MIIAIVIISVVFIGVGFIVTEDNAKYILSGYNTMSEEERQKINIRKYILFFRKFHIFLGLSSLVVGLILYYFVDSDWGGIFIGIYPIVAYAYLIWKGGQFSTEVNTKKKDKFGLL